MERAEKREQKRGGNGQGKGHIVMQDLSFSNTVNIRTITIHAVSYHNTLLAPFLATTLSIFFWLKSLCLFY